MCKKPRKKKGKGRLHVCDIWLPHENVIVTIAGNLDARDKQYLGERERRFATTE